MSTTGNPKRKGHFETLRTSERMKTTLDCEVANWVQVAQYTPHVRTVVKHSNGKVGNFFIRWVNISVSRIPVCGVGYLYIRCNKFSKRMLGQEVFLFSRASRPALGPTKLSIRRVPHVHFLLIKRPEREVYHLLLSAA
jgi:hypothetical protein